CLRGWLAGMMANPRRRRAIIMGITVLFIVVAQAPNLYFNVIRRGQPRHAEKSTENEGAQQRLAEQRAANRETFDKLLAAQDFVPPLWLPAGAYALAKHRPWPALLGSLGCAALGALGLYRAYRATVRFYRG